MASANFRIDPRQTLISITYENEAMVADKVLPRVRAGNKRYSYKKYRLGETYRIQNTQVGRTSRPNETEYGYDIFEGTTKDYGLEDPIPQDDIDSGENVLDDSTVMTTEKVLLDRERRVAALVTDAGNYAYSTALVGNAKFSNHTIDSGTPANESHPIQVIQAGIDTMIRRPNMMVLSQTVFSQLAQHPKIISAYHGNDGKYGLATVDFLKELFMLEDVVVAGAWKDTSRIGQADSVSNLSRIWGKSIALLHVNPRASLRQGVTWGLTAQWKSRTVKTMFDPDIGLEGGQRVRVGEHLDEIVTAKEFGYLIADAIA